MGEELGVTSFEPFCNEEKKPSGDCRCTLCVEPGILDYVCIVLWNSTCAEDALKRVTA